MGSCEVLLVMTSLERTVGAPGLPRAFSLPLPLPLPTVPEPSMGKLGWAIFPCIGPDGVMGIKESNPCALFSVT
jgi:hypothetical protein